MKKAVRSVGLFGLPLVLVALVSTLSPPAARAADPQPVLVYQDPADGEVIQQSAFGIQLCFESPVNIKDLDKGGDFAFTITEPDGLGLGNRDVFQRDGYGVTVYPGGAIGATTGRWKFHYRVTSPDAQSALEGDINYSVDPNGTPFPQATPPVCVESGGTATPSPMPGPSGSATPLPTFALNTPTPVGQTFAPTPTPSATPSAPIVEGGGGSSHTLTYVLAAVAVAAVAGGLLVSGLVIRRRRSAELRPPE